MLTLESLKRKISTADDLLTVVKAMKSLAAANMRQLESAAQAVGDFDEVMDLAWRAWFRGGAPLPPEARPGPAVCLVLGSDQGMCGQFNELAAEAAVEHAERLAGQGRRVEIWSMGERVAPALADRGLPPARSFHLPGGLPGTDAAVYELVAAYEAHASEAGAMVLAAVANEPSTNTTSEGGGYRTRARRLLPKDRAFADQAKAKGWPRRCLPMIGPHGAHNPDMLRRLFRYALYIDLYRAMALSMAAENAARLAAMQAAEKNIRDRHEELQGEFRETRQNMITTELLDIASGFEAITGPGAV